MSARRDWGADGPWPDFAALDRALLALDHLNDGGRRPRDATTAQHEAAVRAAFLAATTPENSPQDVAAMDLEEFYTAAHHWNLYRAGAYSRFVEG